MSSLSATSHEQSRAARFHCDIAVVWFGGDIGPAGKITAVEQDVLAGLGEEAA